MLYRLLQSIAIVALSTRSLIAQSEPKAWTAAEMQQILKQRVDVDRQCVGIAVGVMTKAGSRHDLQVE